MKRDASEGPAGYIRLWRRLVENPVWTQLSPAVLKVMIAFLFKANWKPATWYDGSHPVQIPRGAFVTSYSRMAEFCNLTPKQIRLAFDHLEKLGFAAYTRAPKWTVVTVVNYMSYQDANIDEGTLLVTKRARSGHDRGTTRAPIEEGNKGRREENTPLPPPPEGGAAVLFDIDNRPFDAQGLNDTSQDLTVEAVLDEASSAIHGRHPNQHSRRDCSVGVVRRKLAGILKYQRVLPAEQRAFVEAIDRTHAALCASEGWRKEGGQYAKGLESWLCPSKERYLAGPPAARAELYAPPPGLMTIDKLRSERERRRREEGFVDVQSA